jgi:3'(2'), 5'-bisphosphate nucleotidase
MNSRSALMESITAIALEAGDRVMDFYGHEAVKSKEDNSPLTQADLAAHRIIHARLGQLKPDIPIISEEGDWKAIELNQKDPFWLVDPLDGTKEFIAQNGEFTINIALIEGGIPILGVVFAPAINQLFVGATGIGARLSIDYGKTYISLLSSLAASVHSNPTTSSTPLRILSSRSHRNEAELIEFLKDYPCHTVKPLGSSLKFCYLAMGEGDMYPRFGPTMEWDTAAGDAIIRSLGGFVVDLSGQPLRYGKAGFVNPQFIAAMRHDYLISHNES